jgi:hypothetical protein
MDGKIFILAKNSSLHYPACANLGAEAGNAFFTLCCL